MTLAKRVTFTLPKFVFVNLLKPIEISDEYGEGVEDIRQVLMVMGYMKL
jgi:hypothetical protein